MAPQSGALLKKFVPSNPWKALAIIFALLNLKSLPFVWHLRLLQTFFHALRSSRHRLRLRPHPDPTTLFQPVITTSRSGPLECDYNLHKSNSTYFSDFDIGRLQAVASICGHGIDVTRHELAKEMPAEKGSFAIMLGGVACNFRREIKPFEKFEVWTRILAWDRKWLFVVGHFVRPGIVKPKRHAFQSGKNATPDQENSDEANAGNGSVSHKGTHPAIFASAIAKYVFKKGRLTIPPERILRAAKLLPPKSADSATPLVSETPILQGTTLDGMSGAAVSAAEKMAPNNVGDILAASLTPKNREGVWDWQAVESERLRGMRIAELYQGLEALNEEFSGEDAAILER